MVTEKFISIAGRCTTGNKNSFVVYVNGVLGHVNNNVHLFYVLLTVPLQSVTIPDAV